MSQILNYKFYLNFKNDDSFGRIEITEPVGFDGAGFIVEQEDKRFGRDAYKINEEVNLVFEKGEFDSVNTVSQLPNGTMIYNLTQGFDYIIDVYNQFGYESDVDFEIELNGETFIPSNLDFQTSETDGYSKFSCKALQGSSIQTLKRRSDFVVDLFSDKDVDGNYIEPVKTTNILLKAKPENQTSQWKSLIDGEPRQFVIAGGGTSFNLSSEVIKGDIEETLSFIPGVNSNANNFKYIRALNDISDVVIDVSNLVCFITDEDGGNIRFRVIVSDEDTSSYDEVIVVDQIFNGQAFDSDYTINIPFVRRGKVILIDFRVEGGGVIGKFGTMDISITGTSTAIDTVIKGVRWVDAIKQNIKSNCGLDFYAPLLDVGGRLYDNFAFTGNLIKQRDDVAFPTKFDDLVEHLQEHAGDFQITQDFVYSNNFEGFYPNKEIAAFAAPPDTSFSQSFNNRFAINQFEIGYKEFEQNEDEVDTIDAVHTTTQWSLDNKQVENTKTITLNQIRDAFKISTAQKEASKKTTSTSDDDEFFLADCVNLAPSAKGGFAASMTHYIDDNDRLRLVKSSDLPSWGVLGLAVGGGFTIIEGENVGYYLVYEIEDTVITLEPSVANPSFDGVVSTVVSYEFVNVEYTNRTNEGFTEIENLINPNSFSNLLFTPKRDIKEWEKYLATCSFFVPNGTFRNRYFRNNGALETRFGSETENTIEKADIPNSEFPNPILSPWVYQTRLLAPFNDMKNVIDSINTINEDNSIGGFIRCIDNNGKVIRLYPQKLDYVPSTETLTLTGEQKYDGEGVTIEINGSMVTVNEVGYDIFDLEDVWYEMDGDYLKIYDSNHLPIITTTKYDEVTVDGNTFDSAIDLFNYLANT